MNQSRTARIAMLAALVGVAAATPAAGQPAAASRAAKAGQTEPKDGLVTLDFADVELSAVIETIAKMTHKNFIYDDRVRGRVTIVSPTPMPVDQAYAVFESVLQVKGFTTIKTPGGAIKVVPVREAKESNVETVESTRPPPNRDRFVTRLIPLNYIDADSIVNTLKPLVSKDAAMAAYAPTNTVILTESASNIRRLIKILESIDVETYKEELAVLKVEHADAATLADQISEIYGAEVSTPSSTTMTRRRIPTRRPSRAEPTSSGKQTHVKIITDDRTNSLLVLAPRQQLEEVRRLVAKLDVPVHGGGRIHVYYLKNANAEDLAQTLGGLIGGTGGARHRTPTGTSGTTGRTGATTAATPAIRSAVTGLAGGEISITADPATNSLIIQSSQEGFNTLKGVIEKLDVERPQVLVEGLIMEVSIGDGTDLGFNALLNTINGDTALGVNSASDSGTSGDLANLASAAATAAAAGAGLGPIAPVAGPLVGRIFRDTTMGGTQNGSVIDAIIRASAKDTNANILSAPHILTSDNEQAEIRVGDNIPIISSRVSQPTGVAAGLASSVNVERQDVGVTLRVTPQITEGDSLRLEIFQEITAINKGLAADVGTADNVGVPLSNRRIENTVVVKDGETVVIGGLIRTDYQDDVTKVPWLGDIPILGWAFKTQSRNLTKSNLLVFLTPHIVRTPEDLEHETIRKREEFRKKTGQSLDVSADTMRREEKRYAEAKEAGRPYFVEDEEHPLRARVEQNTIRYPVQRMHEIEQHKAEEKAQQEAERAAAEKAPVYYLQAAIFGNADAAKAMLTDLIDSGHDGTLVSQESDHTVIYEIDLGPYPTLEEAEETAAVVRRSHGLSPSVIVVQPDQQKDHGEGADSGTHEDDTVEVQ